MGHEIITLSDIDRICEEICDLIQQKKNEVKKIVNDSMVSMYWGIGKKLSSEQKGERKPEYGKSVVSEVALRLAKQYGTSFDKTSISRMIKFYEEFPEYEKVATLS